MPKLTKKTKTVVVGGTLGLLIAGGLAGGLAIADEETPAKKPVVESPKEDLSQEDRITEWYGQVKPDVDGLSEAFGSMDALTLDTAACEKIRDEIHDLQANKGFPLGPDAHLPAYEAHNAWGRALSYYQIAAEACIDGDPYSTTENLESGNVELEKVTEYLDTLNY